MAVLKRRISPRLSPVALPRALQVFGWPDGYNDTNELSSIQNTELGSGSQNIVVTNDPLWRTRNGSTMHIGYLTNNGATANPVLGLISYVYGSTRRLIACASDGSDTKLYHDSGGTSAWTAFTEVFDSTTALVESVIRDDNSMLYMTNGVDSIITWTGAAEARVSTAQLLGRKLAYWLGRLVATNVTANPNRTNWSDEFAATFTSTSFFPTGARAMQGNIVWQRRLYVWNDEEMWRIRDFTISNTGSNVAPTQVEKLGLGTAPVNQRTCVIGSDGFMYWMDRQGQVWRYNDSAPVNISTEKIQRTIDDINFAKLQTKGCGVAFKDQIRFAIPSSSATENDTEIVYDIRRNIWYPPQKGLPIGVYCVHPDANGTPELYYGDNTIGAVFKMEVEDVYYDETVAEEYTATATDVAVDGNPAKRAAQSFQLTDYTSAQSVSVTKVAMLMKKNAGTTTDLTVRIETDNGGLPSGTLVTNGSATLSAFTGTTYLWRQVAFSTAPVLTGSTTYWLVVKHATEASGNSQYYWSSDNTSPTYSSGNLATYEDSTSGEVTFSPNANPESTSVDGYVETSTGISDVTFTEIRAGTYTGALNSADDSSQTAFVGIYAGSTTDTWTTMQKGILLFDTSSLPDDASISAAELQIYVSSKINNVSQSVGVTSSNPASNTALAAADYLVGVFGSTKFASDTNIDSLTANSYNTIALNASGITAISVSGITKFALRLSCDIDNSAPTWSSGGQSYIIFQTADGTNKPKLVVTYTSAGGSAIWTAVSGSDQDFKVYTKSAIDSRLVTRAFPFSSEEIKDELYRIYYDLDASGAWNAYLGFNTDDYADSWNEQAISLSVASACFGTGAWGTGAWGVGKWGGGGRATGFLDLNTRNRHTALRIRTNGPSEYFQAFGVTLNYRPIANLVK